MTSSEHALVQDVEVDDEALRIELTCAQRDLEHPGVSVQRNARTHVTAHVVAEMDVDAVGDLKHALLLAELALGRTNCGDECRHFSVIFLAWGTFDAARHVHPRRPYLGNRCGDVVRTQP